MFEIWIISLVHAPSILYLSADEQGRAAQFRFEPDRVRYQRSHSALRAILSTITGVDPLALQVGVYPHGKPYLLNADVHFNLSHAGEIALCAVADVPVGVDAEYVRPIPEWRDIAVMIYSQQECAELEATPAVQRDLTFLNIWTRKEAIIKATGEGFHSDLHLSGFSVPTVPAPTVAHLGSVAIAHQPYSLTAFQPADGYLGAAALQTDRPILPTLRSFNAV